MKERLLPPCLVCGTDLGTRREEERGTLGYLVLVIGTHAIPGLWVILPVPAVNGTGGLEFLL